MRQPKPAHPALGRPRSWSPLVGARAPQARPGLSQRDCLSAAPGSPRRALAFLAMTTLVPQTPALAQGLPRRLRPRRDRHVLRLRCATLRTNGSVLLAMTVDV